MTPKPMTPKLIESLKVRTPELTPLTVAWAA